MGETTELAFAEDGLLTSHWRTEMRMYPPNWSSRTLVAALLTTFTAAPGVAQDTITVSSPDGRNRAGVTVDEGRLYYLLSRDGRSLLMPSMLGFQFKGAPTLRDSLR